MTSKILIYSLIAALIYLVVRTSLYGYTLFTQTSLLFLLISALTGALVALSKYQFKNRFIQFGSNALLVYLPVLLGVFVEEDWNYYLFVVGLPAFLIGTPPVDDDFLFRLVFIGENSGIIFIAAGLLGIVTGKAMRKS